MSRGERRRPEAVLPTGPPPWRTCLGCRRVRRQAELLRLVRRSDGTVEPDPGRRLGGRGAYLCRAEACLAEAIRRGRWAQAFRAPAALTPESIGRMRALLEAAAPGISTGRPDDRVGAAAGLEGR